MKRTISVSLVAIMLLASVSCSDTTKNDQNPTQTTAPVVTETLTTEKTVVTEEITAQPTVITKDEMLAEATEVDFLIMDSDTYNNIVAAKKNYCDKTILISGIIADIKADHIELKPISDHGLYTRINVYLSEEELLKVTLSQMITVVGHTNNSIEEVTSTSDSYTFTYNHFQMEQAYLVQDEFEVTGTIHSESDFGANSYNFKIGNDPYLKVVYFLNPGEYKGTLTVRGKIIGNHIYDAVVVE